MMNLGQQATGNNENFLDLWVTCCQPPSQKSVPLSSEFHPFDAERLISIDSVGYFNYQVLTSRRREFVGAKKLRGGTVMTSSPEVSRMAKLQI